jgi:hypothetical protein
VNIGTRVYEAMGHAIQAGVDPNELLLGPKEMKEMREHLDSIMEIGAWEVLEDGDVLQYQGLNVRPMVEDGLRVGRSFE